MKRQVLIHPHKKIWGWHRLMILLLILSLALVACGGDDSSSDDGDGGGDEDIQTQDAGLNVPDDAIDKGVIEYGQSIEDEITSDDEQHSYQFAGVNGDNVLIRINATGSAFTSPYAFLYGTDDALIMSTNTSATSRSSRFRYTLGVDGTYTIIVKAVDGHGVEPYGVSVELEE